MRGLQGRQIPVRQNPVSIVGASEFLFENDASH
jgi:hypothetical protein